MNKKWPDDPELIAAINFIYFTNFASISPPSAESEAFLTFSHPFNVCRFVVVRKVFGFGVAQKKESELFMGLGVVRLERNGYICSSTMRSVNFNYFKMILK